MNFCGWRTVRHELEKSILYTSLSFEFHTTGTLRSKNIHSAVTMLTRKSDFSEQILGLGVTIFAPASTTTFGDMIWRRRSEK